MGYAQQRRLIPFKDWLVWTDVVGAGPGTPLLCIPGGPGLAHDYLEALAPLSSARPVVFYDPLGSGRSTRNVPVQWTLALLRSEVLAVCAALGLARVNLFAHAAGCLVALEAVLAEPRRFAALVLSSPAPDVPALGASVLRLIHDLPAGQAIPLERGEREPGARGEDYMRAYYAYARKHVCRIKLHLDEMLRRSGKNNHEVHRALMGGLLLCTGALRDLSLEARLREIAQPTLLTCGRHGAVTPAMLEKTRALMPRAEARVFEDSSHVPHLEEPEAYLAAVSAFLERADAGA